VGTRRRVCIRRKMCVRVCVSFMWAEGIVRRGGMRDESVWWRDEYVRVLEPTVVPF
jgi:hypothetical protein